MCLRDVSRKIKDGTIFETSQVMRDVSLIFANAVQFNGVEEDIGIKARGVWSHFERFVFPPLSVSFLFFA